MFLRFSFVRDLTSGNLNFPDTFSRRNNNQYTWSQTGPFLLQFYESHERTLARTLLRGKFFRLPPLTLSSERCVCVFIQRFYICRGCEGQGPAANVCTSDKDDPNLQAMETPRVQISKCVCKCMFVCILHRYSIILRLQTRRIDRCKNCR